ncbi:MAG: polyphosphate kinase 1 [Myxococcales bacterium]|nr:polyphosphate kinase 1 [Myxococcales bacterium]
MRLGLPLPSDAADPIDAGASSTGFKKIVEPPVQDVAASIDASAVPAAPNCTPPHPGANALTVDDVANVDALPPTAFLNRELTYLNFCWRVLHEATEARTPLLERLKFVSIVASNIDEFFMKRIGGLKQQAMAGLQVATADGRSPQTQVAECLAAVAQLERRRSEVLETTLADMRTQGIAVVAFDELSADEQASVREHYVNNIFPLVTPQSIDPAHPFPFISNLSLNLLVTLHFPKDQDMRLARVKVPIGNGISRFVRVGGGAHKYVRLEDVMAKTLDLLFPGMVVESCHQFRVTRNANTERAEEEADDLVELIEIELRERKFAPVVRMQVAGGMPTVLRGHLAAELGLDEHSDVFEAEGMLRQRDVMELAMLEIPERPELRDAPHSPVQPADLTAKRNIFHTIRDQKSLLVHHPYESFQQSVERFLKEAATDLKVLAIKMTLYRTSRDSDVIKSLIKAAMGGKQVAVVLEIKARFDEEANIRWATRMERAGIHVTYGVVGLKTHCKSVLVVRRDYDGLRRYAHIGTGNYHSGTARLYTDFSLLTCVDAIGRDLTELFNYLTTGYEPRRRYSKLLVAPNLMKAALLKKIEREIAHQKANGNGKIQWKINALEDVDIVRALYAASQQGVQIDLIIRDSCRLRPGIAGLSASIRVVSVVGRFLEHARIYHFGNNGRGEYYIGSADAMHRNLERRVEVLVPIEEARLQAELRALIEMQLAEHPGAWHMQSDGSYHRTDSALPHAQVRSTERAEQRLKEATRANRKMQK